MPSTAILLALLAAALLLSGCDGGQPGTFKGYACTVDCSGHEAGYAWAEKKGITDPDRCGGNSRSFIEGCKAFASGR